MADEKSIHDAETGQTSDPTPTKPDLGSQAAQSTNDDNLLQESAQPDVQVRDTTQPAQTDHPANISEPNPMEKPGTPSQVGDELAWFNLDEAAELNNRMKSIQGQFVDEPCSAVEQCEALVSETAERLRQIITGQRQILANQWLNHDDISTEELRMILVKYRSILNKMLKS